MTADLFIALALRPSEPSILKVLNKYFLIEWNPFSAWDLVLKKSILILKFRALNIWVQEISVLGKFNKLVTNFTMCDFILNVMQW